MDTAAVTGKVNQAFYNDESDCDEESFYEMAAPALVDQNSYDDDMFYESTENGAFMTATSGFCDRDTKVKGAREPNYVMYEKERYTNSTPSDSFSIISTLPDMNMADIVVNVEDLTAVSSALLCKFVRKLPNFLHFSLHLGLIIMYLTLLLRVKFK